jgi:hypothetical protein
VQVEDVPVVVIYVTGTVSNAIDACCDVPDPKIPKFEVELLNVDV